MALLSGAIHTQFWMLYILYSWKYRMYPFEYTICTIHMLKKRTAMPATWVLCKNQSGPSIDCGEEIMPCPSIGPKLCRTSLNCLVRVQNRFSLLFVQIENIFWTSPKQFGRVQNLFGLVDCRGTRQNNFALSRSFIHDICVNYVPQWWAEFNNMLSWLFTKWFRGFYLIFRK